MISGARGRARSGFHLVLGRQVCRRAASRQESPARSVVCDSG
ncbi:hypothetical protein [Streptomyces paromomycinus]|nr:hypothetical protein [Streptomyces paromomycinus]